MKTFILQKSAGASVPSDIWDKFLPDYTSALGMATLLPNGTFETTREMKTLAPEDLNAILKDFKDQRVIFAFHEFPEGTPEENIQPFELVVDAKGVVKVVGFMAGDFSQYEQTDSSHDPALHCAVDQISPVLQKIFDDCKGDMKKFLAEVKTEVRKKALKTAIGEDNHMILALSTGEVLAYTKQNEPTEWGWTSEIVGEAGADETGDDNARAAEPKKPLSFADRLKAAKTGTADVSGKTDTKKLPEGGSKTWDPAKFKTWRPNEKDNMSQTKRREAFWREVGYLPDDWKDQSEATNKRGWPKLKKPVTIATLDALGIPGTVSNAQEGTQQTKDTGTKHVPESTKPKATSTPAVKGKTEEPHVLGEDAKNYVHDTFFALPDIRAAIDKGGKQIMSPEAIAKEEKDAVLFSEAVGMEFLDALAWRRSRLKELAENAGLDAIVDLCNEFRLNLLKTLMAAEGHQTLDANAEDATNDDDDGESGAIPGTTDSAPPAGSFAARLAASKKAQGVS